MVAQGVEQSAECSSIQLRCPACGVAAGTLDERYAGGNECEFCGFRLENRDGILWALPRHRHQIYARFLEEYSIIRTAEGRGSEDPAYYLALPFRDLSGRNTDQWAIRCRTFKCLNRRVLPQFDGDRRLDILDLGAGAGWLSYQLARRKHRPVAVDILTDPKDGLGAARHYQTELVRLFPRLVAEFDNLPFIDAQFDLAIFNSSLHYSPDYSRTLTEAKRCLRSSGALIILDSPIYRCREHGERMREERHRRFEAAFGFRSDSIPSREYLYDELLEELASSLDLRWKVYRPWYGWKWHLRPWKARFKGQRPPSRFKILVGNLSR